MTTAQHIAKLSVENSNIMEEVSDEDMDPELQLRAAQPRQEEIQKHTKTSKYIKRSEMTEEQRVAARQKDREKTKKEKNDSFRNRWKLKLQSKTIEE